MLERLEIRKYPNRRYYDSTHSRHLTLEQIRKLIQEGHDVRVVDSKTSADITARVLTQIILELDAEKLQAFPVPLLFQLIRVNHHLVRQFLETYVSQPFAQFVEYQKQLENQLRSMYPTAAGGFAPPFPWAKPFMPVFSGSEAPVPPGPEPTPAAPGVDENLKESVRSMQRELAELRSRMSRRKAGGGSGKGAGKPNSATAQKSA